MKNNLGELNKNFELLDVCNEDDDEDEDQEI
jgi:hypothetical protein